MSREDRRAIGRDQRMLNANMKKYGCPYPNDEFEDDEEEQEKQKEKNRKSLYNYKDKTEREKRIMFEDYYGEQIMQFKNDNSRFEVYKSDSGEVQVMGIASLSDKSQLTAVERIQAIYAKAITRQRRYVGLHAPDSDDDDEEDEDEESSDFDDEEEEETDEDVEKFEMIPLDLSSESVEASSNETDQSDECTEIGDSIQESLKSSEEERGSEEESRTSEDEDLIYQETLRKVYDDLYKYRHHFETRRDVSV